MPTDEILKAKGSAREDALASIGSGLGAQNMPPPYSLARFGCAITGPTASMCCTRQFRCSCSTSDGP
jgi:hypothetical protein